MGKQTTMKAPHQAITKFEYNSLGELLRSTDPEGNHTDYSYNMLGQLLERDHPDAGVTSYSYDKAGNLRTIQTANLASASSFIEYEYEYNRLVHISYPRNPEYNVYYEYGLPDVGNSAGRLIKLQDTSGVQTFEYGKLGKPY